MVGEGLGIGELGWQLAAGEHGVQGRKLGHVLELGESSEDLVPAGDGRLVEVSAA